jgi:hypothetical protein
MEFIKKLGRGITKGGMVGSGGSWKQRELSFFQMLLKLMLTYEKGKTW